MIPRLAVGRVFIYIKSERRAAVAALSAPNKHAPTFQEKLTEKSRLNLSVLLPPKNPFGTCTCTCIKQVASLRAANKHTHEGKPKEQENARAWRRKMKDNVPRGEGRSR